MISFAFWNSVVFLKEILKCLKYELSFDMQKFIFEIKLTVIPVYKVFICFKSIGPFQKYLYHNMILNSNFLKLNLPILSIYMNIRKGNRAMEGKVECIRLIKRKERNEINRINLCIIHYRQNL